VEVQFHEFLTSGLVGDEFQIHGPVALLPQNSHSSDSTDSWLRAGYQTSVIENCKNNICLRPTFTRQFYNKQLFVVPQNTQPCINARPNEKDENH
jgi:hypothetical protein